MRQGTSMVNDSFTHLFLVNLSRWLSTHHYNKKSPRVWSTSDPVVTLCVLVTRARNLAVGMLHGGVF